MDNQEFEDENKPLPGQMCYDELLLPESDEPEEEGPPVVLDGQLDIWSIKPVENKNSEKKQVNEDKDNEKETLETTEDVISENTKKDLKDEIKSDVEEEEIEVSKIEENETKHYSSKDVKNLSKIKEEKVDEEIDNFLEENEESLEEEKEENFESAESIDEADEGMSEDVDYENDARFDLTSYAKSKEKILKQVREKWKKEKTDFMEMAEAEL